MLLACKCLNFLISTSSPITPVSTKDLDLSPSEVVDSFFSKNLGSVEIENITKAQECLVTVHNIGSWVVHNCLNCKFDIYASRKQQVLVSMDLLSDPVQIKELKQSPDFSSVFNIVLQPLGSSFNGPAVKLRPLSETDPLEKSVRLSSLNQHVSKYISNLTAEVEEKIRQFSEEQYSLLETNCSKIQAEHKKLVKILTDSDNNSPSTFSPFSNNILESNTPLKSMNSPLSRVNRSGGKSTAVSTSSLSSSVRNSSDASDEFMFDFEDGDNPSPQSGVTQSEEEMSDTDDSGSHDEGIHIPRRKEECSIAKSLPMKIPNFSEMMNNREGGRNIPKKKDDKFRDTQDIAASIQALAKSVHGDTPFGDLPRPRLSSQI